MDNAGIQRSYYARTASQYDALRSAELSTHGLALHLMLGAADHLGVKSVLDIGSGTGRAIVDINAWRPDMTVVGIEPVRELREVGYSKGLTPQDLRDGNALALDFPDSSVDLVCEFATLHHIERPDLAVSEMLRVARKAIFISDTNNFGQGSFVARTVKHVIRALGLWPVADYIKTRGRGYTLSEGDGLAYSYSVFSDYAQIREQCEVFMFNTGPSGGNLFFSAPGVALLGIKR